MKIIFLDVDGVLNSEEFFIMRPHTLEDKKKWTEESDFDQYAVKLLNKMTDATDAKIFVSSCWRVGRTVDELKDLLKRVGIAGEVIGKTKQLQTDRGFEIADWLENHEHDQFIIIDDEFDMEGFEGQFIHTGWKTGLTDFHVNKAIGMLGC